MKQTNYLKLFSILAFVLFGGVSCWATAESLHLLLASWPKIFCYLVAIGFFVVASIGTKLIVDSLNQKIYVEGRGSKLFWGIILVLIFWLAISMPTNTHTFIYRNVIADRVNNDITTTQGYLDDVINNNKEVERVEALMTKRKNEVRAYQMNVCQEVQQPNDPGSGPQCERILNEMKSKFGDSYTINPCKIKGTDQRSRNIAISYYNDAFEDLINNIIPAEYVEQIQSPNETNLNAAITAKQKLDYLRKDIENKAVDLFSAEDMNDKVKNVINEGYTAVTNNRNLVDFKNGDELRYSPDRGDVTETSRMLSIFEVWGDYFNGKFAGHGFLWWIILAILIDVAAFIFFDIAFKKSEY